MIGRVAKAILGLDGCSDNFKRISASAAIAAMREPLAEEFEKIGDWVAADVLRDIIRATLAEKGKVEK
jgi:hypothetical protein